MSRPVLTTRPGLWTGEPIRLKKAVLSHIDTASPTPEFVRLWCRIAQPLRDPTRSGQTHPHRNRAVSPGNPGVSWLCSQRHALTWCVIRGGRRIPVTLPEPARRSSRMRRC